MLGNPVFFACLVFITLIDEIQISNSIIAHHASRSWSDGTTQYNITTRGWPFLHWMEFDGYVVAEDSTSKSLVYATGFDHDGQPIPGKEKIGKNRPPKNGGIHGPGKNIVDKVKSREVQTTPSTHGRNLLSLTQGGSVSTLVLMVRFNDHLNEDLPTKSDYSTLFNQIGGDEIIAPTGSVKDFFNTVLYNRVNVEAYVSGWIDVPYSEADAAGPGTCFGTCSTAHLRSAIVEALSILDKKMDLSTLDSDLDGYIDMLTVVHSGFGAEWGASVPRIWSHKWALPSFWSAKHSSKPVGVQLYNANPSKWGDGSVSPGSSGVSSLITRIGVIVHEMLHSFGLPDLYDIDGDGAGVGVFDVMGNSWGADYSQRYPGTLSAWSRVFLGLLTPQTINSDGSFELPLNINTTHTNVLLLQRGFPSNEYILIEYRSPTGFDSLLQGGILVWHIDINKGDNTQNSFPDISSTWTWPSDHYKVRLIQQDNLWQLERNENVGNGGDWWGEGKILFQGSSPSLNAYAFMQTEQCTGNAVKIKYMETNEALIEVASHTCGQSPLFQTEFPTKAPTNKPTKSPTVAPSRSPSFSPTEYPTKESPTAPPVLEVLIPTEGPSASPTSSPSKVTKAPTQLPTAMAVSPTTSINTTPTTSTCEDFSPYGILLEDGLPFSCKYATNATCVQFLGVRLRCRASCSRCERDLECTDIESQFFRFENGTATSCTNLAPFCLKSATVRNLCPSTCNTCSDLSVIRADKVPYNTSLPVIIQVQIGGGNETVTAGFEGNNTVVIALGSVIVSFMVVGGGVTTAVMIKKRNEELDKSIRRMHDRLNQGPSSGNGQVCRVATLSGIEECSVEVSDDSQSVSASSFHSTRTIAEDSGSDEDIGPWSNDDNIVPSNETPELIQFTVREPISSFELEDTTPQAGDDLSEAAEKSNSASQRYGWKGFSNEINGDGGKNLDSMLSTVSPPVLEEGGKTFSERRNSLSQVA